MQNRTQLLISERIASVASSTAAVSQTDPSSSKPVVDVRATLETLELDTMGATWLEELKSEFKKPYFLKVRPGHIEPEKQ